MVFARAQGKKILILHNIREGKKVKQKRLHSFKSFDDALETMRSPNRWALFCDALETNLPEYAEVDRESMKKKIQALVNRGQKLKKQDPLVNTVRQLSETLKNLAQPLSPGQLRSLLLARTELEILQQVIDDALALLKEQHREDNMLGTPMTKEDKYHTAMEILHRGLEHYDAGEWDQAKSTFIQGLRVDPKHVDLHVHLGLCELMDGNHELALSRFEHAMELGRIEVNRRIQEDPDDYIKYEDYEDWLKGKTCELADECPSFGTEACDDCDEHPGMSWTGLYQHLENRPFFRAMTNKAVTLIRMSRYQQAIDTLLICQSYDDLWGVRNMIGECYLCLNNLEEANTWYIEMLWSEAFYVKSLILTQLGELEEALKDLLTGVTQNWHIAHMLKGTERPNPIRYIGQALPKRLEASEFIHEKKHLFKGKSQFQTMLRCILEDPEIIELLSQCAEAHQRWEDERGYKMPRHLWNMINGNMNPSFFNHHIPRLLAKLLKPGSDYWMPKPGESLNLTITEKKQMNWIGFLPEEPQKTLYFRPANASASISEGDTIGVTVNKSWYYNKRLFMTGKIADDLLK